MTTVETIRRLVERKKYFPVDIETFKGRYIIWLAPEYSDREESPTPRGLTSKTLSSRFKGTGFDATVFGHEPEPSMFFFYLSEERVSDEQD